ncbi:tetratricopeptide repeat protein [Bdellovibrio sp. NC01]|uniref:tetratricopeptide repeat protein n=1 Tax=Bdellovibrio sp. NC01 TaxID=2220073 RepID=UPI00115C25F3|nr:tetratricopeptide repeat protein [Bdellovibrio sp. NC01]QDK37823.1 hypothetical protein DOE51_09610 [Bdellovibrio sp. NC01]
MSTKLSKEDLKSPDQVTKTLREGFVWTTTHSKLVVGAIAIFVVIGGGISISGYLSEKKETEVQEKYFLVEKAYNDKKRGFEEASRAEMMAAQSKDKKVPAVDPSKKATGDLQKDYGTVVPGFEALINDGPKTKAAQMAALNLSAIYIEYKKPEEALATLQKVEKGLNKSDATSALILLQTGNVQADKGDCKAAVDSYQKIADSKAFQFAHDEAKLRMGLCYEAMNDSAKAEQLYTEVAKKENSEAPTDVAAVREASKYLRLLKAKKSL